MKFWLYLFHRGGELLHFNTGQNICHRATEDKLPFGFKDKSTMLRVAIDQFKKNLELEQLKQSADLYAEDYSEDNDLKELTETALDGWPE